MDNQFNNGQNNPQNYGATLPVDNPGFVQTQPQYNQGYGATMPVDNPGFSQPQEQYYNPGYGATMPVDNPGFNQPQQRYNNQGYGATMQTDNSGYGATMPVDNPGFNQPQQSYNNQWYGNTAQTDSPGYNQPLPPQQQSFKVAEKKKKTGSKISAGWLVALCISLIVIISGALIITFVVLGKKKQINDVKNTNIKLADKSYSVTYGELFGKTVKNLKWDYFKEDGEKLVQAKGDYQMPDTNNTASLIVQFNVDNGVTLSCISVNGQAYSIADSERFIVEMYNSCYGIEKSTTTETVTTEATTEATTESTTQATTEATTEATTQATTEEKNEYILKNSSSEYLAVSDIAGMSKEQCRLARNEIYARHGRLFDDPELQAYFNSCSWYVGYIEPDKFDESVLNAYEKSNLELIVAYEKDMGYR
ncbi:MAG: YARHG domain-containing protein [Lachnospiraceae bacterium]|nr:YARHG domain-containing protein [Lachnospiraceae bacterium]